MIRTGAHCSNPFECSLWNYCRLFGGRPHFRRSFLRRAKEGFGATPAVVLTEIDNPGWEKGDDLSCSFSLQAVPDFLGFWRPQKKHPFSRTQNGAFPCVSPSMPGSRPTIQQARRLG